MFASHVLYLVSPYTCRNLKRYLSPHNPSGVKRFEKSEKVHKDMLENYAE